MNAHVPTMFLMIIVISACLAASVALIARVREPEGTGYWALAIALNTLTYVLFIGRGQINDWLSIVLANVFLSSAFALFLQGILQFQKRAVAHWLIWLPVVVEAVVFAQLIPWQNARNIANAVILSAQILWIVALILQRRKETVGRGQYFVTTGFLMLVAVLAMQGIKSVLHPDEVHYLLKASLVQTLTFLVSPVSTVLLSLGLVVMSKERADQRNQDLAMRDELTKLFNRRSVLESLTHHVAMSRRSGLPMSLLIFDIDHFKRVNDTFGHLSGDRVLRELAQTLLTRTREQDVLGRYGGEEFLVILPDTTLQGARRMAEALRKVVEDTPFHAEDGQPLAMTVSVGVSTLNLASEQHGDALIGLADQALYRAKQGGRNRVEVA
jgi:diguanylate cyclase (GGDEF)-like protein